VIVLGGCVRDQLDTHHASSLVGAYSGSNQTWSYSAPTRVTQETSITRSPMSASAIPSMIGIDFTPSGLVSTATRVTDLTALILQRFRK